MKIDPTMLIKAAGKYHSKISQMTPLGGMEGIALAYERDGLKYVLKVTQGDQNNINKAAEIEAKSELMSSGKDDRESKSLIQKTES